MSIHRYISLSNKFIYDTDARAIHRHYIVLQYYLKNILRICAGLLN